jgi:hypothetical protein
MRMLLQGMPTKGSFYFFLILKFCVGFILTFVSFFTLLLICIIIGATGPHVYDSRSVSAYGCPPGQSTYDPSICDGVDLALNGTIWTGEIRNLDKLNQELLLIATLKNKLFESTGVEKSVQFSVDISGRNNEKDEWSVLETSQDVHSREVTCPEVNSVPSHGRYHKFREVKIVMKSHWRIKFLSNILRFDLM